MLERPRKIGIGGPKSRDEMRPQRPVPPPAFGQQVEQRETLAIQYTIELRRMLEDQIIPRLLAKAGQQFWLVTPRGGVDVGVIDEGSAWRLTMSANGQVELSVLPADGQGTPGPAQTRP